VGESPASPRHHSREYSPFSFSGSAIFREVVAVHVGEVLQQPLDLALAPSVGGKFSLNNLKLVLYFVMF
jgi:hypothetical protein